MNPRRPSVNAVLDLRDRLAALLEGGGVWGEGWAGATAPAVEAALPPSCRGFGAVAATLRLWEGKGGRPDAPRSLAHALAGNLPRLAGGRPVPPWRGQPFEESCDIQIVDVGPRGLSSRTHKPGRTVRLKVMTGLPAGRTFEAFWPLVYFAMFARRAGLGGRSGRSRLPPRYPYSHPSQVVSLRFRASVKAGETFRLADADPSHHRDHNHQVLRFRFRTDPNYHCPRGYPAAFACHHCAAGTGECPGAVHSAPYEARPCPNCGRPDALFDPAAGEGVCVECRDRSGGKGAGRAGRPPSSG